MEWFAGDEHTSLTNAGASFVSRQKNQPSGGILVKEKEQPSRDNRVMPSTASNDAIININYLHLM
jgi:hypothetical protein